MTVRMGVGGGGVVTRENTHGKQSVNMD